MVMVPVYRYNAARYRGWRYCIRRYVGNIVSKRGLN